MTKDECKRGLVVVAPAGHKHVKVGIVLDIFQDRARVYWYAMKNRTWMKIQSLSPKPKTTEPLNAN